MHVKYETNHIKAQQSNNDQREQSIKCNKELEVHVQETCPVDEKCQTSVIIYIISNMIHIQDTFNKYLYLITNLKNKNTSFQ